MHPYAGVLPVVVATRVYPFDAFSSIELLPWYGAFGPVDPNAQYAIVVYTPCGHAWHALHCPWLAITTPEVVLLT
jgi:hypothetical protein